MRIGLDIDNVITNFDKGVLEAYYKEDKLKRDKGIVNPNGNWIKNMFDWSVEETEEFFDNNMERIAKTLEPIQDCKYYMDKLLSEGHELYLISHRVYPHYHDPYNTTVNWLKDNNINYTKLVLTETTNKSKECLEHNIDIMFDDVISNCEKLLDSNILCYLMETKYNVKNKGNLKSVKNWHDLYNLIYSLNNEIHVILDTDTNNEADDQFALAYLLKSRDNIILDAVTIAPYSFKKNNFNTITEGIDLSYKVAKEVFSLCNQNSDNLIFKGSTDYLVNGYDEDNDAVDKIIDVARKNKITYILTIGCPTNVALAIKKAPDIIEKIKVIFLGGHSFLTKNNNEFNFRQDIEANRLLFYCGVDLTIIPCKNVASNLVTSIYELANELNINKGLGKFLYDRFYNDGRHGITKRRTIWDIAVIGYIINPSWFDIEMVKCPLINEDLSYSDKTLDHEITFITNIDVNSLYNDMFNKLGE